MKVEFKDWRGEYGYASNNSGHYEWHYEGDEDEILSILVAQDRRIVGHGRPEGYSGEIQIDERSEFTGLEKVKTAWKKLQFEGKVSAIEVDEERVG